MGSEKEQEGIIELTDVLEEGPAFAARNDRPERLAPEPENKKPALRPQAAHESIAALPDSNARMMNEALTRQAENWAAREGARLVERLAADFIPRIVGEKLSSELAKIKAETDALRAREEAFSRKMEEWFSSEGLKSLEQATREAAPRVAAEALQPEIEKFQARGEELSRQAQAWFAGEGKQILEKVAREVFPQMAEKVLRQEIEKLKEERRATENE